MKQQSLYVLSCCFFLTLANALNMMSMIDGVDLGLNSYLEVENINDASERYVDERADINQILTVDITTINLNQEFDILIFNRPEGETSSDYECYKSMVKTGTNWTMCDFSENLITITHQQHFEQSVKSLNDSNNQDRFIVIDNTPYPEGGTEPQSAMTLIMQTRTEFNNQVSVKSILILEGMICLILLFAIGVFSYLYLKMKAGHEGIEKERKQKISIGDKQMIEDLIQENKKF